MLEMLLNPKAAERKPWEMFFVGLFYAAVSMLLVNWLFSENPVFSGYSSMLVITFTVMLSLPFVYFIIKMEEEKDYAMNYSGPLFKTHRRALYSLMWLFVGFVIAFSAMFILFPSFAGPSMDAPLKQYCMINYPSQTAECIAKYTGDAASGGIMTGKAISDYALSIFVNNIYVLIFCLIFSLLFGAGAIFILAWNASVIATAIWIFSKSSLQNFPAAFARYMIHGVPEIAAYFTAALAGGIISIALIRHDIKDERFWNTLKDSVNLIVLAIALVAIGTLIEAFVTPKLF